MLRKLWIIIGFASLLLLSAAGGMAQVDFHPASFGGLVLGRAKIADAYRRFGETSDVTHDNSGTVSLRYKNIGPVPGIVDIFGDAKTNVIEMVELYPEKLSLQDAKKLFGPDYTLMRFDWDMCLNNGGDIPIYESLTGPLKYVVYPRLGIAMLADENPITIIMYLTKPLGSKQSRCKPK